MHRKYDVDIRNDMGKDPLLVGRSDQPSLIIPRALNDFLWCEHDQYFSVVGNINRRPIVVSWSRDEELGKTISRAGAQGAWVMTDSVNALSSVSTLASDFQVLATDTIDNVQFFLIAQGCSAMNLPFQELLESAIVAARTEENRRNAKQELLSNASQISRPVERPSSHQGSLTDSTLRRKIKSVLNGREKQLAAKLPRPIFRFALRVWKAL